MKRRKYEPNARAVLEYFVAEFVTVIEGLNERESARVLDVVHELVERVAPPKKRRGRS